MVAGRVDRIALIGETLADVREVMVEGASGIVSVARLGRPRYEASRRRVVWENGAVAQAFSSEDPESLRGPQFAAAWCDELAKWKNAEATYDMLQFGLRLAPGPVQLITTTPRPVPLVRRLIADGAVRKSRLMTADNAPNLAPGFIRQMERRYGGTRLGARSSRLRRCIRDCAVRATMPSFPGSAGDGSMPMDGRGPISRSARRRRPIW